MLMAHWVGERGGGQRADFGGDCRDPEKGTVMVWRQAKARGTVRTCQRKQEVRDGEGWKVEARK